MAFKEQQRNSNIELYRIIVMFLIVCHHYVVNSELLSILAGTNSLSFNTAFYYIFGAWGKTGINCFVLITGYYMCNKAISLRKWLKLYLAYLFWSITLYFVFYSTGYINFSLSELLWKFFPFRNIHDDFVNCFMLYYLLIPFLNSFVQNISKKQHFTLILILLSIYSGTDLLPNSDITFNYITWFSTIHIIASYLRFYPEKFHTDNKLLITVVISFLLIASADIIIKHGYYGRVSDCNAVFAVLISTSSFLLFKNINIPQNILINTFASATFGVLLIHANSDSMREWLWNETIQCAVHYSSLTYPVISVCVIYIICTLLELIRIKTIEVRLINQTEKIFAKTLESIKKLRIFL